MTQIPSTAIEIEMILDYLSNSILKWAVSLLLFKVTQREDVEELIALVLPNSIRTVSMAFLTIFRSTVNENFLLLVRYDSGKDRCSLLRINY